ncbi:unnamed protein product [Brassica oleracea var. botrytis]|uniref:Uncharacterized protein n=1 Tax=Brassica oleracea TaxID=3712 RepID=A0A3P6GA28_BRAOL|nr:unnamed protein product [Brassica oleracea]
MENTKMVILVAMMLMIGNHLTVLVYADNPIRVQHAILNVMNCVLLIHVIF